MFEVGWTEMLVIAIVMIVVVGPKDLPRMLRTFGRTTAKLRSMAGDFQKQFNEALQEAELDDVKKSVDDLRKLNPAAEIRKQLNPFEKAAADVRAGLDSLKPAPPPKPADPAVHPAEPLKNGATDMPGELAGAAPDALKPDPSAPAAATAQSTPAAAPVMAKPDPGAPSAPSAPAADKAAKGDAKPAAKTTTAKAASRAAAKPAAKAAVRKNAEKSA